MKGAWRGAPVVCPWRWRNEDRQEGCRGVPVARPAVARPWRWYARRWRNDRQEGCRGVPMARPWRWHARAGGSPVPVGRPCRWHARRWRARVGGGMRTGRRGVGAYRWRARRRRARGGGTPGAGGTPGGGVPVPVARPRVQSPRAFAPLCKTEKIRVRVLYNTVTPYIVSDMRAVRCHAGSPLCSDIPIPGSTRSLPV